MPMVTNLQFRGLYFTEEFISKGKLDMGILNDTHKLTITFYKYKKHYALQTRTFSREIQGFLVFENSDLRNALRQVSPRRTNIPNLECGNKDRRLFAQGLPALLWRSVWHTEDEPGGMPGWVHTVAQHLPGATF